MFCYYPQLLCLLGFVGILGVVADSHRTLLRQGTKKNEEKPDDAYSIELSLFEKASTEELVRFLDRELQTTIDSLSPPPTSAPTEMEGVCDAVSTSPFSQSLLFDFEGPIGLVTPADIVALEQVLLDAYNAVAMCDTPGAFISADSVDIDIDTADSIGDNIDTGSSALLNYTWLVTFSGNCRGCQSNPGGVETMPACSCDLPTTEALVLECNSRLQTFSSYRLTLLRATVLVPPTAATPAPRTNFTTSIAVSGRGGLFEDFSATLWQILFVETYNFLNFWNFALCDSNARIITSVIPENPVQDPNDSSLFSIVFTIQGSCSGCGSQSIIFGSHSATPQETGTTCPAGASFRCPTNIEFEEALQMTIDQMSGALLTNVTNVGLPVELQNQFITCVAVIDETQGQQSATSLTNRWNQLRSQFPFRPFCLLQPSTGNGVFVPTAFTNDPNTIFSRVTRDNNNVAIRSDWYDLCDLDASFERGLDRVALFIDNSGSMTTATVQAANDLFLMRLAENNITDVREPVVTTNEDYITPCLTTSST